MSPLKDQSIKELHDKSSSLDVKTIKDLANELEKVLNPTQTHISSSPYWEVYKTFIGKYKGKRFQMTISKHRNDLGVIEIFQTTKDPQSIISLIRGKNKAVPITYTEITYTEKTI